MFEVAWWDYFYIKFRPFSNGARVTRNSTSTEPEPLETLPWWSQHKLKKNLETQKYNNINLPNGARASRNPTSKGARAAKSPTPTEPELLEYYPNGARAARFPTPRIHSC